MLPWRQCSRVPNLPVPLAEGLPGRADLARRRAITLQVGSPKDGSGPGSEPLLAITAGQAADIGLCRPPALDPGRFHSTDVEDICFIDPSIFNLGLRNAASA
jgi:hypothetical protein